MSRTHRFHAFTLTELLVVVAIVGLLAGLVIASLGRVQRSAQQAQGTSALRGLINAVFLHAADNRGVVPGPLSNQQYVGRLAANHTQFVWKLQAYLDAPSTPEAGQVVASIAPQRFLRDYDPLAVSPYFAVNNLFTRESGMVVRVKPWGGTDTGYVPVDRTPKALLAIPQRERRVAVIDLDARLMASDGVSPVAGTGPTVVPGPLYGASRNAVFWDGHVEQVSLDFNLWPDAP